MTTVRQLRALSVLDSATLVGGEAGLDGVVAAVVASSSAQIELPTLASFVIIDGSQLGGDSYLVDMALRAVSQHGGSALLVTARERPFAVTAARLANKLHLPLLVTSNDDTLGIADALRQAVVAPTVEMTRMPHRVVEALRHAGNVSLDVTLERISTVLEASVSLIGLDGGVMAGAALDAPWDDRDRVPVQTRRQVDRTTQIAHPVELAPGERPSVWVLVRRDDALDAWADTVAGTLPIIAWAISSTLVSARLRVEIDARSRLGILNSIVGASEGPSAALLEQMAALGWRFTGWCTAVHIHASGNTTEQRILASTSTLAMALERIGIKAPLIERPDGWTLWLETDSQPHIARNAEVERALLEAVQTVADQHSELHIHAGIGAPRRGFDGLRASLGEAREAAVIAQGRGGRVVVQHIDTLGIRRILYGWYASPNLGNFAETLLQPVVAADGSGDLFRTLEVFLDHESSPTATAAAMFVHRNTVLKRMERVRDLLAVDLDDPEQRLAVQLSCRMVRLQSVEQ